MRTCSALGAAAFVSLAACSSTPAPSGSSFDTERERIRSSLSDDIHCDDSEVQQVGGGSGKIRGYSCSIFTLEGDVVGAELIGVGLHEESGNVPTKLTYSIYLSNAPAAEEFRPDFEKLMAHYGFDAEQVAACKSSGRVVRTGQGFSADCAYSEVDQPPGFYVWITEAEG